MATLESIKAKWRLTFARGSNLTSLREGVRYNGAQSPCLVGYRSVCWKIFLLFGNRSASEWSRILNSGRSSYAHHREELLRFIDHPETLSSTEVDPLSEDPKSPWNTTREDEAIREEIEQDVRRLPDVPFYHKPRIQKMVADILFMYCKLNPSKGGYRQGMHELVAPIVLVLSQDAVDCSTITATAPTDITMLDILNEKFIEPDAYAIFFRIMKRAGSFYEVSPPEPPPTAGISNIPLSGGPGTPRTPPELVRVSPIIARSTYIHDVCLRKVDPELARHFKNIEILPQIFLIRWIRLLFSREFPLEDVLIFWDTLFAVDSDFELMDLICVAMILRIRWQLIDADLSTCLQLLLKYPPPSLNDGPHTFIDDACYLQLHLNTAGGASIIEKYSGRLPSSRPSSASQTPSSPSAFGGLSFKGRTLSRSPLASPSRFINQSGGMEAILQGAAKGMFERSEKLGINRAVRDAMGEFKKNVQQLQEAARNSPMIKPETTISSLERRNAQLAQLVNEVLVSLQDLSASGMEDRSRSVDIVELLTAKLQFVKLSLEDSTIRVPASSTANQDEFTPIREQQGTLLSPMKSTEQNQVASGSRAGSAGSMLQQSAMMEPLDDYANDDDQMPDEEAVLVDYPSSDIVEGSSTKAASPDPKKLEESVDLQSSTLFSSTTGSVLEASSSTDAVMADGGDLTASKMEESVQGLGKNKPVVGNETSDLEETTVAPAEQTKTPPEKYTKILPTEQTKTPDAKPVEIKTVENTASPKAPIPVRSTISQSSLAWMLEPSDSPISSPMSTTPQPVKSPRSRGAGPETSRERNAFLFGETNGSKSTASGSSQGQATQPDDGNLFGLEPMPKSRSKVKAKAASKSELLNDVLGL